ncbi:MAG: helix-turn-helix domain-containing protein [Thermoleophilia bacterium]
MEGSQGMGARLREARMRQGLDLDECVRATRIRERYLVAIEEDRIESLPDPAYYKGFVRAYAAHLGVPVEGPVRDLPKGQIEEQSRPPPVQLSAVRPRAVPVPRRRRIGLVLAMAVAIVLVVTAAAFAAGVFDLGV